MTAVLSAHLDRYALLGHPVGHSRSPFIHAEFARQTGQAVAYEARDCALDGFAEALRQLMSEGARGCNVTVPFKFDATRLAHSRSTRCELAGAANVLIFDGAHIHADNSDGVGLVRDIEAGAGRALAGTRVLLVGAGGAAAGVLGPLLAARPAELQVVNRSVGNAQRLVTSHQAWADQHGVVVKAAALHDADPGFDVVINASASSLAGAAVPVSHTVLAPGALAVDLMYGAAAAPFLAWAQAAGAQSRDGLGMLVEQAAEAFWLWRGVRPHTAPVLQALRATLPTTLSP
jgi:shikimate dehydrogenase